MMLDWCPGGVFAGRGTRSVHGASTVGVRFRVALCAPKTRAESWTDLTQRIYRKHVPVCTFVGCP